MPITSAEVGIGIIIGVDIVVRVRIGIMVGVIGLPL